MSKKRYQRIIGLLTLVLLVSCAVNYIFFTYGRGDYLQLKSTRLNPLGLDTFPNESIEKTGTRIVFFGDSRAAQWPDPALEGYQFINRGIGSQTSSQALQRYDFHIEPLAPEVLIVQVGTNDLKTLPLFPDQRDAILTKLRANIQEIVKKATAENTTAILTTIFPVGKVPIERKLFWSEDVSLAIEEINAFIFSLAGEKVVIFDAYSILVGENGKIRADYSQDLLHLNETGYAVLNQEFEKLLIDLDLSGNTQPFAHK
jgi:lysophospholipase L1-like esterase